MPALPSLSKRRVRATEILERLNAVNPDPRCELFYQTPFQLLVSVVLSAQTTDKSVNKAMEPLYREAPFTPETVLAIGVDGLLAKIRSIGLAPTKAKNVYRLSQILLEKYQGQVPETREELEALPGVGRKTANVILGEIFRHPTIAVDTHVFRVSARLGLQDEKTPEKAELELLKVIDPALLPAGHHHFILHGRYVCKAAKPECAACVLNTICPSAPLFLNAVKPLKKAKTKAVAISTAESKTELKREKRTGAAAEKARKKAGKKKAKAPAGKKRA